MLARDVIRSFKLKMCFCLLFSSNKQPRARCYGSKWARGWVEENPETYLMMRWRGLESWSFSRWKVQLAGSLIIPSNATSTQIAQFQLHLSPPWHHRASPGHHPALSHTESRRMSKCLEITKQHSNSSFAFISLACADKRFYEAFLTPQPNTW